MIRTFLLSLLALVLCSSAQAADPYVTGTYRPVSQGWRAEFTLHNALEDETIFMWYAVTADAGDVGTPAGWHIRQDYRKVGWDANSVADRLQPGASLSGYNFTSQAQTSTYGWYVGSDKWGYVGTVTLDLVPEPSAVLALAGGLGVLGLPFIRRRR